MYKLLLEGVLWAIRSTVDEESPNIMARDLDHPQRWWAAVRPINTPYGYQVDREEWTTRIIDYLLGCIPIEDEAATLTLSADPTLTAIRHHYLSRLPAEVTKPTNLADFLLSATGSFFLRLSPKLDEDYQVDLSYYEQFGVRRGFYRYGGVAHISEGRIDHFIYRGEQYAGDDPVMQEIFKATLCFELLAGVHAIRIHLCTAQQKTIEFRGRFGADHPLVDLLYMITFGVLDINRKIALLLAPHGLVARVFAFTKDSFRRITADLLQGRPMDKRQALGLYGTEWNRKITPYYTRVEQLVAELCGAADIDDTALEEELSAFFVASTALHNQVGDAQIYSMTTSGFFLPKVYKDTPGKISAQDYSLMQTLLVAVSPRYPLIIDPKLSLLFRDRKQAEIWAAFAEEIRKQYAEEDWFAPPFFETSVGF